MGWCMFNLYKIAIIWTNIGLLFIGALGTNFSEIRPDLDEILRFCLYITAARISNIDQTLNSQGRPHCECEYFHHPDSDTSRIPPSIHHGGARKVASHDMPVTSLMLFSVVLISYNDQFRKFIPIGVIWSRGILPKVRYQSRICWVGNFVDRTGDAVISYIQNSPIRPLQRL